MRKSILSLTLLSVGGFASAQVTFEFDGVTNANRVLAYPGSPPSDPPMVFHIDRAVAGSYNFTPDPLSIGWVPCFFIQRTPDLPGGLYQASAYGNFTMKFRSNTFSSRTFRVRHHAELTGFYGARPTAAINDKEFGGEVDSYNRDFNLWLHATVSGNDFYHPAGSMTAPSTVLAQLPVSITVLKGVRLRTFEDGYWRGGLRFNRIGDSVAQYTGFITAPANGLTLGGDTILLFQYDILEPTVIPPLTLPGLQGPIADRDFGSAGAYIQWRNVGLTTPIDWSHVSIEDDGMPITGLPDPGTYDISLKPRGCLRETRTVTVTSSGLTLPTITLRRGDINEDNSVDLIDYFSLSDHFAKTSTDAEWERPDANDVTPEMCDLNGDGEVDLLDYFYISDNYNDVGDN